MPQDGGTLRYREGQSTPRYRCVQEDGCGAGDPGSEERGSEGTGDASERSQSQLVSLVLFAGVER